MSERNRTRQITCDRRAFDSSYREPTRNGHRVDGRIRSDACMRQRPRCSTSRRKAFASRQANPTRRTACGMRFASSIVWLRGKLVKASGASRRCVTRVGGGWKPGNKGKRLIAWEGRMSGRRSGNTVPSSTGRAGIS
jgi:hypothetical protein